MISSIIKSFKWVINCLQSLPLFGQSCALCGCSCAEQLCAECLHSLPRAKSNPQCPRCLFYLPPKEIQCANCQEQGFYFERTFAAYPYAFPLNKLLHALKYSAKIEYSYLLSNLMWHSLAKQLPALPDAIIPVPLHTKRHKLRGFNQVYELLREFRRLYPDFPLIKCIRRKDTVHQTALSRQQRLNNLAYAFELNTNLSGMHIALVDDVVTTGTTVNELAKLCKQHGATRVDVWCLLRVSNEP